ncbi:copper fist DNA binding domain-containing protein [Radiomyces spectabilis]|uniref:copper fist DNA binding domain-containing protein n=1 Tax=Radiomyces spectabilis TaxID=64574 RepID=UPI002220AF39|nr:copper fist DNA binding domain-containing protein [Radiomyces spectabilis]KAI8381311.1 copper fist DNA binding domain-containing protein [Radiomyces spectabilis]
MIIIDNVKYACITCIKGHRSSQCTHKDRQLLPIRPKGRPVSQCERCREQRLSSKVHQKCVCSRKKTAIDKKTLRKKPFSARQMMAIEALLL